jgi:hypothetical protein
MEVPSRTRTGRMAELRADNHSTGTTGTTGKLPRVSLPETRFK